LAGVDVEDEPIASIVQDPGIGVFGHSNSGTGVRGHGGPLKPPETDPPPEPPPTVRGGIFSAGWQSEQVVGQIAAPQRLGLNSIPQMRIVPSTNQTCGSQARRFLSRDEDWSGVGARDGRNRCRALGLHDNCGKPAILAASSIGKRFCCRWKSSTPSDIRSIAAKLRKVSAVSAFKIVRLGTQAKGKRSQGRERLRSGGTGHTAALARRGSKERMGNCSRPIRGNPDRALS
jgi:hypothetical protein